MIIRDHVASENRVNEFVRYGQVKDTTVWIVDDIHRCHEEGGLEEAEQECVEELNRPEINSIVVYLGGASFVSDALLRRVHEKWTQIKESTDVEKSAYVGNGLAKYSIKNAHLDISTEIKTFGELGIAIEWATKR